ncbi:MAG: acylneuraminate cytidylyltransferase family protein [Emcibacteraceae bacterium]
MTLSCIAFIFARGGSKGLPGKNKKPLNGIPLLAHSIITAKKSPSISHVILSTEDKELAEIGKEFGAEVPFIRPKELAADNSPEWLSWQHAITEVQKIYGKFDVFVSLPPTAPLRSVEDVEICISLLKEDVDVVVTCTEAARNPYFNMLRAVEKNKYVIAFKPEVPFSRRQDAPSFYDMTTVAYVSRPSFILNNSGLFDGNIDAHIVPTERAIDIDTIFDFKVAELMSNLEKVNGND